MIVAVGGGGIETRNLLGDQLGLVAGSGLGCAIGALNGNFGRFGYEILGKFVAARVVSYIDCRANRYYEIEVSTG